MACILIILGYGWEGLDAGKGPPLWRISTFSTNLDSCVQTFLAAICKPGLTTPFGRAEYGYEGGVQ